MVMDERAFSFFLLQIKTIRSSSSPGLLVRMSGLPSIGYVASPKDETLQSYFVEALVLLELRFKSFDSDGAGYVIIHLELETLFFHLELEFFIMNTSSLLRHILSQLDWN